MAESVWPDDVPSVVRALTECYGPDDPCVRLTTEVLDLLFDGGFDDPGFVALLTVDLAQRHFESPAGHLADDLPRALVTALDHLGSSPVDDTERHRDLLRFTTILAKEIPELCPDTVWAGAQRLWPARHATP
jgi:hypothetical protein